LDNVFQNFCSDFADFIFDRDPIRSARRRLEYRFQDQVTNFFNGIRNGVVPTVLLPQSLMNKRKGGATDESGGHVPSTSKKAPRTKGKPDSNPEAKAEWGVPEGKNFGDYFSPARNDLKPNRGGWPTFPHHINKTSCPMCLRFQTTGECTVTCGMSHMLPSKMDPKIWGEVKTRLKTIMSN
jgi:hypothetical protein